MELTFEFVKDLLNRIPKPLRNRYVLSALGLICWITFFDSFDLFTTVKNQHLLSEMEDQKEWYHAQIIETKEDLHELNSDDALLEKFARERYLMKRDNEDIYILVPKTNK